jgi:hypothetical protein
VAAPPAARSLAGLTEQVLGLSLPKVGPTGCAGAWNRSAWPAAGVHLDRGSLSEAPWQLGPRGPPVDSHGPVVGQVVGQVVQIIVLTIAQLIVLTIVQLIVLTNVQLIVRKPNGVRCGEWDAPALHQTRAALPSRPTTDCHPPLRLPIENRARGRGAVRARPSPRPGAAAGAAAVRGRGRRRRPAHPPGTPGHGRSSHAMHPLLLGLYKSATWFKTGFRHKNCDRA